MTFLALQTLPAPNPDVSLALLAPELIVSVAGVLVMLVDAFTRRSDRRWLTGTAAEFGHGHGHTGRQEKGGIIGIHKTDKRWSCLGQAG